MTSLRDRCRALLDNLKTDGILRQGSPVDTLRDFVIAEIGRSADERLDSSAPLCLYFATEEDREEFIEIFKEARPNAVCKRMP